MKTSDQDNPVVVACSAEGENLVPAARVGRGRIVADPPEKLRGYLLPPEQQ